jgi:hypothetical protein
VRVVRDDQTRQTGGIISAAVDGLKTAKAIVAAFAPLAGV